MYGSMRKLVLVLTAALAAAAPAWAGDSASLQFTVPAPDPVQAGETLAIQALAVNTGTDKWDPQIGSYYWVAEIYDLEYRMLARTEQVSPQEAIAPGAVAAVSLPFHVPDTAVGRRLYRIFLVKDSKNLITSEYKPFQIVEKPLPPAPEVQDYRLEGNVTLAFKNSSRDQWKRPSGATTINTVGKVKDSSYLFNAYLLHEAGKVVDPFIIVLNYYAPWGTIYAGDVSPTLSPLSVSGQGMRGAMLEQKKDRFSWNLAGGQTITSQAGTAATNGRYARSMYAAKGAYSVTDSVTTSLNAFVSSDEIGSLSSDPKSNDFRGPSLLPQKNTGYGLGVAWTPAAKTVLSADYENTGYQADAGKAGVKDSAWKGEFKWDRRLFKLRTYVQRAGPRYVSFGAPSVAGDRMTYDAAFSLFPLPSYTLALGANQYQDNLASDPRRVTTTQRLLTLGNALQLPTGTGLGLNLSLNTARGKPAAALDNQTTTMGLGVSQALGRHSASLGVQMSQFKDKNRLAHDLDSQTVSLTTNLALPRSMNSSFGVSDSQSKDKVDGSKRSSLSISPSLSFPIRPGWSGQVWGAHSSVKNTSPVFPADAAALSVNSEFTWARSPRNTLTFGVGYNQNKDKVSSARSFKEGTLALRYSLSF